MATHGVFLSKLVLGVYWGCRPSLHAQLWNNSDRKVKNSPAWQGCHARPQYLQSGHLIQVYRKEKTSPGVQIKVQHLKNTATWVYVLLRIQGLPPLPLSFFFGFLLRFAYFQCSRQWCASLTGHDWVLSWSKQSKKSPFLVWKSWNTVTPLVQQCIHIHTQTGKDLVLLLGLSCEKNEQEQKQRVVTGAKETRGQLCDEEAPFQGNAKWSLRAVQVRSHLLTTIAT